jgi:hypothetical protein
MQLKVINGEFSVCKVKDVHAINFSDQYCFIGKTDEEISLVCSTACVPRQSIERSDGWCAFRIQGVLDFSLTGVLSKISAILAENKIGIFAISTFNTDYILTQKGQFEEAMRALEKNNYTIIR